MKKKISVLKKDYFNKYKSENEISFNLITLQINKLS